MTSTSAGSSEPERRERAAELLPQVYDELKRLAQHRVRGLPPGQTLQATALVHEAYMRLVGRGDPQWRDEREFFAAASLAMRRFLVESFRRKGARKRAAGRESIDPAELVVTTLSEDADILELDGALSELEARSPRAAEVVSLHFFAGLTQREIAGVLAVAVSTVERDWAYARAWLRRRLAGPRPGGEA
ncbi:MAG: ECF-type sigma factor [Planctomycetota bacterium]